ncbi:AbrB/MazE/SpoVT family DNA-binding domain-containing protein [Candidatus Pacearchaeota archaeon]|nr:AbrB/MazE/SpoVT family DNA-binding domain-containing protein [Candidatus Pacearchaeota archaeon]
MVISAIKMSSKGQVVIPRVIRNAINAEEGTLFIVINKGNTIVLEKVKVPTKDEVIRNLEKISLEGQKNAERLGIKESDVPGIIEKYRRSKRNESNSRY